MRSLQDFLNTRHPPGSAAMPKGPAGHGVGGGLEHELASATPPESVSEFKKRLRSLLQQERLLIKQTTISENWGCAQQQLAFQFLGLNINTSHVVASFFPIRTELNLSDAAQKNWMFPFSAPDRTLRWFFWRPQAEGLNLNSWGIPEPALADTFEYNPSVHGPVLMFVPCLAVSALGTRLGYGGGFYDRFLAQFQNDIVTIACVPEPLFFDHLPTENHDIPVDIIATEARIHSLQKKPQLLCRLRT